MPPILKVKASVFSWPVKEAYDLRANHRLTGDHDCLNSRLIALTNHIKYNNLNNISKEESMDFQNYDDIFNKKNYPIFSCINDDLYIPQDGGACVCLSGKKYKDCCKNEIELALKNRDKNNKDKAFDELYNRKNGKMISNKVETKSIDKKNLSYCSAHKIFGNCDNTNNNTRSHTMSRSNILKNLADDEKLICFNDHKIPDDNLIDKIAEYYQDKSIDDASVTVSFCKKHDVDLFAEIETAGNTTFCNTDVENLEYALKSISFDIYYKLMNIRYLAELIKQDKNVAFEDDNGSVSRYFKDYYLDVITLFELYPHMLNILSEIKELKEKNIKPKLKTVVFELPSKKVNFSCSEVIFHWNKVCFINVINSPKPYLIISYYSEDGLINELDILKKEYDSLKSDKRLQLGKVWPLINLLLINAQNIYFNKKAYETLPKDAKTYLYIVHREGIGGIPGGAMLVNTIRLLETLFPM